METEFCPDCRLDLELQEFTRNARMRDGLSFYFRACQSVRQAGSRRQRFGPPPTRRVSPSRPVPEGWKWCPECDEVTPLAEFPRNRRARNGLNTYCKPCHNRIGRESRERNGGHRNYHLRRRYGVTTEHFDRMLAEQNGMCAICKEALGQFRDRTDLMLQAVAYLRGGDWKSAHELPGVTVCFALVNEDPDSAPPADAA